MKFRIVKCLVNDKINKYALIYNEKGEIVARKIIEKDEDGNEYFSTINIFNTRCKNKIFDKRFSGSIKDAVETVKAGNGDCICRNNISWYGAFYNIRVLYYLDRNIGEDYRERTLEGFKDSKFCCIIIFNGNNFVNLENETFCEIDLYNQKIISLKEYDSEEECENVINKFVDYLYMIAKKYLNYYILNSMDLNNFWEFLENNLKEEGYSELVRDIIFLYIFQESEKEDGSRCLSLEPKKKIKNMFRVIQHIMR